VGSGDIHERFWETEKPLPMLGFETRAVQPVSSWSLWIFKIPDIWCFDGLIFAVLLWVTASCTMGTWSFPGVKSGRGVTLTPHPLLVSWSRKGSAIPLLPLWAYVLYRASVPVQECTLPLLYCGLRRCEFCWQWVPGYEKNIRLQFSEQKVAQKGTEGRVCCHTYYIRPRNIASDFLVYYSWQLAINIYINNIS